MSEFTYELVPQGRDAHFHLQNAPGEEFRQVFAQTPHESSPLNTKIKLMEAHHGKMILEKKRYEATLLLFHINFQSQQQDRRYKSVCVTFKFFDKGKDERLDPEVVKLSPDQTHWLRKTTYDRTVRYGGSLGAKSGIAPAEAEAGVHWEVETTKPRYFKATITGNSSHSRGKRIGGENVVEWAMEENQDEEDGVPSFLQAAVLLKRTHSGPFYAKLRISSTVDAISRLNRTPLPPFGTDEDKIIDHVTFTPGNTQLENSSFTGIQESDLDHMERLPIEQYCRVNLPEDNALLAPTPGLSTAKTEEKDIVDTASPAVATPADAQMTATPRVTLAAAAEAVTKAAESAAKAAEAAAKAAEAAARAAEAVVKAAEASTAVASAERFTLP